LTIERPVVMSNSQPCHGQRMISPCPEAERRRLVRAAVPQREEAPVDVEHPDRAPLDLDDPTLAGGQLRHAPHDVLAHARYSPSR
jgi:hypothetical protein